MIFNKKIIKSIKIKNILFIKNNEIFEIKHSIFSHIDYIDKNVKEYYIIFETFRIFTDYIIFKIIEFA